MEAQKISVEIIKLVRRKVPIIGTINHIAMFIALSLLKPEINFPNG